MHINKGFPDIEFMFIKYEIIENAISDGAGKFYIW
jgi:hypothetical protein